MSRRSLGLVIALMVLPGCMKDMGADTVSRFKGNGLLGSAKTEKTTPVAQPSDGLPTAEASPIIYALQQRPSALQEGTPYAQVAQSVIASDARVAEAELQVAQLRAKAAKWNWLPSIGPRVSLSSLGDFVTDLVVNQVLFDNGRKRAERDLAKANVEIAAVNLVDSGNTRVNDALVLYVTAQRNREIAAHMGRTLKEMAHFEWVMQQRVNGGVSDMSDLNVLQQKLASKRARASEAGEAATTALAELNAMSDRDLSGIKGLGGLHETSAQEPLAVIRARAQQGAEIAQAKIDRASHLPGLAANASGGSSKVTGGLEVTTDSLFSLGTMAELSALEVVRETSERKVAEAREVANRKVQAQANRLAAFRRQAQEAATLTQNAKQNLDLFRKQYEGGQRQVMDVVGVYETYASALETEIDLKYKAARAELELARLQGALAEGAQI
ncbi:MAG: TolC family protein [Pelagimonas sp.]|nr:TolC family protein [Pelagimonas sp.]